MLTTAGEDDLQDTLWTFGTEAKKKQVKNAFIKERLSGEEQRLECCWSPATAFKQSLSTIPERGKPQRAEPELENRINESNMHGVHEPGHQGDRASAVVCVLTRSICGNESQLPAAVHKERKGPGSTARLFPVLSGNKTISFPSFLHTTTWCDKAGASGRRPNVHPHAAPTESPASLRYG